MRRSRPPNKPEIVVYRGIVFRRYPTSRSRADRVYYVPSSKYREQGVGRLHQEIWRDAYGPIPAGHHIHHRDGNPLNNSLDNLECVPGKEHQAYHMSLLSDEERAERCEWFHKIRRRASNWHQSSDGRQWHGELSKRLWKDRESQRYTCQQCGSAFTSRSHVPPKFCSNACKSAARRAKELDLQTRECVICGAIYSSNKYVASSTCSRSCRLKFIHKRRREQSGGLQSGS